MTKLQDNLSYNGLHGQTINCQFHDTGIQTLATKAEDQYNNNLPPLLQYNTSSMSHMQTSCLVFTRAKQFIPTCFKIEYLKSRKGNKNSIHKSNFKCILTLLQEM